MTTSKLSLLLALALSLSLFSCSNKHQEHSAKPVAASTHSLDSSGTINPAPSDRCAMCGMDVSAHKTWAGAIQLQSGQTFYFCSVRCTLATNLHSQKFINAASDQIKTVRVPNYLASDQSLNASSALFVVDSDIQGPMGPDLVPAASETDAATIIKRHGGRIVRLTDVNDALIKSLKQGHAKGAP